MKTEIDISNATFHRVIAWSVGISLAFLFKDLILILILGIFFSVILEPFIKKLIAFRLNFKRFGVNFNRLTATFFIFLIMFGIMVLFLYKILPTIVAEMINLYENLHNKLISMGIEDGSGFLGLINSVIDINSLNLSASNFFSILKSSSSSLSSFLGLATGFFGGVLNFLLIIVFTFYFCLEDKGIERLIRLVSPQEKFKSFISIWNKAENKIQNWAEGQFIAAIIIGVIVYISLLVAKMPYAFIFAGLSFVGEMIPLVGLILSSVPAIIVAFLFVDIKFAIIIATIFFIIAQIENYIVYPKVMDNKVGVPPLFVLVSILIGVKLLGFWGVVLAVPVAAVIIETVKDMYKHKL